MQQCDNTAITNQRNTINSLSDIRTQRETLGALALEKKLSLFPKKKNKVKKTPEGGEETPTIRRTNKGGGKLPISANGASPYQKQIAAVSQIHQSALKKVGGKKNLPGKTTFAEGTKSEKTDDKQDEKVPTEVVEKADKVENSQSVKQESKKRNRKRKKKGQGGENHKRAKTKVDSVKDNGKAESKNAKRRKSKKSQQQTESNNTTKAGNGKPVSKGAKGRKSSKAKARRTKQVSEQAPNNEIDYGLFADS